MVTDSIDVKNVLEKIKKNVKKRKKRGKNKKRLKTLNKTLALICSNSCLMPNAVGAV